MGYLRTPLILSILLFGAAAAAQEVITIPATICNVDSPCTATINPIGTIRGRRFIWEPQTDITPYELARATGVLVIFAGDRSIFRDYTHLVDALPPEVKRHFREVLP